MERESSAAKARRTHWTATFLAAAELTRRGYIVTLTKGGTPLMVGRLGDKQQFWVDVRGIAGYSSGGWFAHENPQILFYILVSVGDARADDRFFIMSQERANNAIREWAATHKSGKKAEGVKWSLAEPYEARWDALPGYGRFR